MIFLEICLIFPKVSYGIYDEIMCWVFFFFFLTDFLLDEKKFLISIVWMGRIY
jgi:hypothetical protein